MKYALLFTLLSSLMLFGVEGGGKISPLKFGYEGEYLDLGYLYENEIRHASMVMTNVSEAPQTIASVEAMCDCIRLENDLTGVTLQPGESAEIKFTMAAMTVVLKNFGRNIRVITADGTAVQGRVAGRILRPMKVKPGNVVDLGMMKNPAEAWKQVFTIKVNPDVTVPFIFGETPENEFLNLDWKVLGEGEYELTVSPKKTLPYQRKFYQRLRIPYVQPKEAEFLQLEINAQIAEAVNFAPDKWSIMKKSLDEAGEFTERFAYGEVPGIQEEKDDPSKNSKNMLKKSLLRQHNAIPLRFVKENHDWDDLFAHLEFKVPQGVSVEKIRHPQGIELKITVKKDAIAEGVKSLQVIPFRDGNLCAPITINILD